MITLIIIIAVTLTLLQNCDTTEPPSNKLISLTFEDASSTEVWLNLKTENIPFPQEVNLLQNDTLRFSINPTSNDTTLYIDSLLPNKTYKFQSSTEVNTQTTNRRLNSNILQAVTMDTTSHNFIWQKFIFGDIGTSEFNDIEIINKNNIWAVGTIWQNDSLKPFCNGVHWNGNDWKLLEIPSRVSHQNSELYTVRLSSLFISSAEDIWFTTGGQVIHWDGVSWGGWTFLYNSLNDTTFHGINKLGGIPNQSVWAIGNKGNLFKSRKNTAWGKWEKINAGKFGNYYDLTGVNNRYSNNKIFLLNTNLQNFSENTIVTIDELNRQIYLTSIRNRIVSSIWTEKGHPIYLAGSGIYDNKSGEWQEIDYGDKKYIEKIRGTKLNNIFAVGHYGIVAHYNGINWKTFPELEMNGIYKALSVKKNIVAIAGIEQARAVIIIGIKN